MLTLEGYAVLSAENGSVGLALAQSELPHLIVCDIMLPELDGLSVLVALRSSRTTVGIPFIFLTAKGEKPDIRAGMNLGADDYLTKPVSRTDLLNAMQARLARQQQQRPDFSTLFSKPEPLESLGLTPREAEVLFWLAQGKSNGDIGAILDASPATVKKHTVNIFEKLGVENRGAATLIALEALSGLCS